MSAAFISVRRIAGAGLANLIYLVLQSLLFLVLTPKMLEILGAQSYGLWTILVSITSFAVLANFNTNAALVKFIAQFASSEQSFDDLSSAVAFGAVFLGTAGLIVSMIAWAIRSWAAASVEQGPSSSVMADAIGLVAAGLLPLFLIQWAKGILLGLVRNELAGGLDVVQSGALLFGALILGSNGASIVFLAGWMTAVNWTICVISAGMALWSLRPFRLRWIWNSNLNREMLRYSFFAWLSTLGSTLFTSADRLLVAMLLGPAAAGAYGICTSIAMRLNQFGGVFTQLLVPISSSYQAAGKTSQVQHVFKQASRLSASLLAAAASLLLIWSRPILSFWISPDFTSQYLVVFQLLIVSYAVFSMGGPGYQMAYGLGRTDVTAVAGLVSSGVALGLIYLFSQSADLVGAAIGNFGYVLILVMQLYIARSLGLPPIRTMLSTLGVPFVVLVAIAVLAPSLQPLPAVITSLAMLSALVWINLKEKSTRDLLRELLGSTPGPIPEKQLYREAK